MLEQNENNVTVEDYVSFIQTTDEMMSLDHAYTNEALLKLINATNAMANEVGFEIQADLDKAKGYANDITIEPIVTTHADKIKMADDIITNVLQGIQQEKYPSLAGEVAELKTAVASIQPGVLALDQKDAIKNYFAKAADLLQKMN